MKEALPAGSTEIGSYSSWFKLNPRKNSEIGDFEASPQAPNFFSNRFWKTSYYARAYS